MRRAPVLPCRDLTRCTELEASARCSPHACARATAADDLPQTMQLCYLCLLIQHRRSGLLRATPCMSPVTRRSTPGRIALAVVLTSATLLFVYLRRAPLGQARDRSFGAQQTLPIPPTLCAHRIFGSEASDLGADPVRAIAQLAARGVRCLDVDVVRCLLDPRGLLARHRTDRQLLCHSSAARSGNSDSLQAHIVCCAMVALDQLGV